MTRALPSSARRSGLLGTSIASVIVLGALSLPVAAAPAAVGVTTGVDCTAYQNQDVLTFTDRVVLQIADVGAASVTIDRSTDGGAYQRLATSLSGTTAEYVDRGAPVGAALSYQIAFTFADSSTTTCSVTGQLAAEDVMFGSLVDGSVEAAVPGQGQVRIADSGRYTPAYSANGQWMAYAAPGPAGGLDPYLAKADGTGTPRALPGTAGDDNEMAFSWNGASLVYADYSSTSSTLRVVDLATNAVRQVPHSDNLGQPAYLPDGRVIATDWSGVSSSLVIINPTTGARTTLAGSSGGWDASVGSDGSIAYIDTNDAKSQSELRLVRGGATTVKATADANQSLASPHFDGLGWLWYIATDISSTNGTAVPSPNIMRASVGGSTVETVDVGPLSGWITDLAVRPNLRLEAQKVVKALYQDVLGRGVDPSGLQWWTDYVLRTGSTRALVSGIATSRERMAKLVSAMYEAALNRGPEQGGLDNWVNYLASGRGIYELQIKVYSSPESLQTLGNGDVGTWVAAMYEALLGRSASASDRVFWTSYAASHGRAAAVAAIAKSPEATMRRLTVYYQTFMQRGVDPSGRATFLPLMTGRGDFTVPVALGSSPEYWARAQTRF